MTRSYKKNPFISITTAKSEKEDKKLYARKMRGREKHTLKNTNDEALEALEFVRHVKIGERQFAKDGKAYSPDNDKGKRK